MERDTELAIIDRILALRDARTQQMEPACTKVPVERYLDPDVLARETERLLTRRPVILGRREMIAAPGDVALLEPVGGRPLIVRRGQDGQPRAFLNVCRHRGTRLLTHPGRACGKRKLVCPYHAWTYDADSGALERVPDEEGFAGLDRAELGLVEVPVAERHGFIWAHLAGDTIDVADWLGPELDGDFGRLGLADHVRYEPGLMHKEINWKLAFDVFLEAYHLRYAHATSIYPMFFDNLGLFERLRPHLRNQFPKRTIETLREQPREQWQLRPHANTLYVIFPNTLMLVQADHANMFTVWPRGTDACVIETCHLLPEAPATDRAVGYWRKNIDILHGALEEDFAMGESIQAGLRSGANAELIFGRYEQALTWFHDEVVDALG